MITWFGTRVTLTYWFDPVVQEVESFYNASTPSFAYLNYWPFIEKEWFTP